MPSISDALFAGRSGISSHGIAISVLADNIANSNTVGFKASRPDFSDLLAGQAGGGGGVQAGAGSEIGGVTQIFNQGTFEFTGRGLDIGIDGNGFLLVQDSNSGRFFTRAGNLQVDATGNLLDQNGLAVLGFPATGAGGLQTLNVNQQVSTSVDTNNVTITGNLDANTATGNTAPIVTPTDYSTLSGAADFQTFVDVFDSVGGKHTVSVYFFRESATQWAVQFYASGDELAGGTPSQAHLIGQISIAQGTPLLFDTSGQRPAASVPLQGTFDVQLNGGALSGGTGIPWLGADPTQTIDVSLDPFSSFSSPSSIDSLSQDGTGAGSVVSFNIDADGSLFAQLDNGQRSSIGTIALANFSNVEGLRRLGNSLYAESSSSGQPVIGTPASGQFGSIQAGALELSTADLAGDFIKLINLQRGFQGSSRIIGNIDDLLNEIINLA